MQKILFCYFPRFYTNIVQIEIKAEYSLLQIFTFIFHPINSQCYPGLNKDIANTYK